MSLRWFLITCFLIITTAIVVWDRCAYIWASPSDTISGRMNLLSHQHPEIPFGIGSLLTFCSLLPLLPRRRRWVAVFFMFMLTMAVVSAHCVWPVYVD
jgi:hypothetical protein